MNILQPHCHVRLTESFVQTFCDELGWTLYLLDDSWKGKVNYDFYYSDVERGLPWLLKHPKVRLLSYREFMEDDIIDVVLMTCAENYYDILANVWPHNQKCKYVTYYGNDFMPGILPFDLIPNHISADVNSHHKAEEAGVNSLIYRPPIDYSIFTYKENPSNDHRFYSYIHNYHLAWVNSYPVYEKFMELYPDVNFKVFGKAGNGGVIEESIDVAKRIHESTATTHIKEREGYGYGCIESMACGRPVIAYRTYVETRAMYQWVNEKNALLFSDLKELKRKVDKYINDKDYAKKLQKQNAIDIRKWVNPEEQAENMKAFMENLR